MELNRKEMEHALRRWFQPGDVFEIRCIDAKTRAYFRPHIESGYFDYDHIDIIAEMMAHIQTAKGCYVTVNPVKPELINRALNRIRPAGREPTTSDGDILRRRWLLVDCDAKRASGIPSSEDEHDAAMGKALEIQSGFASIGWPDPILTDSGNGAQLMYRVDLPTDDGDLIHKVIQSIAAVSSDKVDIDVTVHNPARIWRLPGTMNCKGDSSPDRPHRMARIIAVPPTLGIVSEAQLRKACLPEEPKPTTKYTPVPVPTDYGDFDLDDWINRHCSGVTGPTKWQDGRKWVFDVCPFNPSHDNKSAVITQRADGMIGFKCHHNSCAGNDWHKLRDLLEMPSEREERSTPPIEACPDVDLSAILAKISQVTGVPQEQPVYTPKGISDDLLDVPGMVRDIMNLSLKSAPYPNRTLAFAGALTFVSFLAGRKFCDARGNFTNIYMIALANSGSGKDHPRRVNFELANIAGLLHQVGDSFASGAGFEDAMYINRKMLFQMDEADWLFNVLKNGNDIAAAESINEKLLKMYGASASIYPLRKKAFSANDKTIAKNSQFIVRPSCTLFGTAIPKYFYESISNRSLDNGLIARCMIMESEERGNRGKPMLIRPSEDLCKRVKELADLQNADSIMMEAPEPIILPETDPAKRKIEKCLDRFDKLYNTANRKDDSAAMSMWARAGEKMCKLMSIYAISKDGIEAVIDDNAVKWASRFVEAVTFQTISMSKSYCYENRDHADMNRICRLIAGHGSMTTSNLLLKTHITARRLNDLLSTMVAAEILSETVETTASKPRRTYSLVLREDD